MDKKRYYHILGIRFLSGGYEEAKALLENGKLMVVPAAPALAEITKNSEYYNALKGSDFAIADSGFMILLLRIFKGIRINKLSGLKFLRRFLEEKELRYPRKLFFIDPSHEEKKINHEYLVSKGIKIGLSDHYVAPMYDHNSIHDEKLLTIINSKRPKYIVINLGGGVQERLAFYLKNNLDYKPGIICTGAAIAFLTGRQANIPPIIDYLYMGWFVRCLKAPGIYVPRYLKGFSLILLILKDKKRK